MTSENLDKNEKRSLMSAAINGESDVYIALEISRRLKKEAKESGKDAFTWADIRRIREEIFAGESHE